MAEIDRRRFLTSLGAATGCSTGVLPFLPRAEAITRPFDVPRFNEEPGQFRRDYWFIKREINPRLNTASKEAGRPTVDFWSRECCDVSHAKHLPPEIPTGVLWYDPMGSTRLDQQEAFEQAIKHIEAVHTKSRPNAVSHLTVHMEGLETLSSTLRHLVHDEPSEPEHSRTALIALDSLGPSPIDPEWTGLLPVFAQCYDRIIGLVHAPKRGLRDWADHLNCVFPNNAKSYFEEWIWDAASQCDVVIVTSAGLVETDPGLCASTTTEMLVGELIRRFGYAMLDRLTHDCIFEHVPTKPHLFALGSATLTAPHHDISDLSRIVEHQQQLVSGSFGKYGSGGMAYFVAVTAGHQWTTANYPLSRAFHMARGLDRTCVLPTLAPTQKIANAASHRDGALDLITLWPFEFDEM